MNKMPEVAKMLGVEIGEEFKIVGLHPCKCYRIMEDGIHFKHGTSDWEDINSSRLWPLLILGEFEIIKLPRYTIPEDLEVDAKVWVRDKGKPMHREWTPKYFCRLDKNANPYICFADGMSSFTTPRSKDGRHELWLLCEWPECITDEDYQKLKEGTL